MFDLKNLTNKEKAYGTILLFGILATAFWYFSDSFSAWAMHSNPWLVMIITILINPAYLFLIYTLYQEYDLRGLFAGILISIAIDIISLGHSVAKLGNLPTDPVAFTYSDTLVYKIIQGIVSGPIAVFILYVLIATGIVWISLLIIRRNASFNKIFKEVV